MLHCVSIGLMLAVFRNEHCTVLSITIKTSTWRLKHHTFLSKSLGSKAGNSWNSRFDKVRQIGRKVFVLLLAQIRVLKPANRHNRLTTRVVNQYFFPRNVSAVRMAYCYNPFFKFIVYVYHRPATLANLSDWLCIRL